MRGVGTGNDQQGVAVRLAARHSLRGEAAGDAGLGLDDDRLPKPFRHLVSKKPADDVHVSSRRETVHELDRTIRIIRRRRRAGDRNQRDERGDDESGHRISLPWDLFLEITAADHCVRAGVRHRLFGVRQWTATSLPVGGAIRQSMATLAKP